MTAPEYSLLGELALRMAKSPEDVATEGLAYVLSRSEAVRTLIQELAGEWSQTPLRRIVSFRSQVSSTDNSRPDIEAQDGAGVPVVIFENKFWAGLTEAQPVGYLQRLEGLGGVLCFVAPAQRLRFLWPEVTRRAAATFPDLQVVRDESHLKLARVGADRVLALTSWTFLLSQISRALEAHGDSTLVADVRQLTGLAARMETTGFVPFTVTDLTAPTARHVVQFCSVVDAVVESLLQKPWASKQGLKASAGSGWYGHYIWLRGHGCQLSFNAPMWAEHGCSPIWLRVASPDWQFSESIERALASRGGDGVAVAVRDGYYAGISLPVPVAEGCEFDAVVDHIVQHLSAIAGVLPETGPAAAVTASPEEPGPS
jgi:hypothetical protein